MNRNIFKLLESQTQIVMSTIHNFDHTINNLEINEQINIQQKSAIIRNLYKVH